MNVTVAFASESLRSKASQTFPLIAWAMDLMVSFLSGAGLNALGG